MSKRAKFFRTLIILIIIYLGGCCLVNAQEPVKRVVKTKKVISDYKKLNTPIHILILADAKKPKTVTC